MTEHKPNPPIGGLIILLLVLVNAIILKDSVANHENSWSGLAVSLPLLLIALFARWERKERA